jgi:hypothetical protein
MSTLRSATAITCWVVSAGRAQQHGQAQTANADRMQRDPARVGLRRDIG